MSRIIRHLYYMEIIRRIDQEWRYVSNKDGTLFSDVFKTKIKPADLPEWYLFGRYHKRFGYMSTKGIVDLVYSPSATLGTFLKDDLLLISYHGNIEIIPDEQISRRSIILDEYRGYDEYISGREILTILKGAKEYSNFDISPIVEQLKTNLKWLCETYPQNFDSPKWETYIDDAFAKGITEHERYRYQDDK